MSTTESAIPGTVHLIYVNGDLTTPGHKVKKEDIILVPAPVDHGDDPLKWSRNRKYLALSCMVLYMWATGVGVSSIYSVFGAISASSNLTLEDLNQGTGYMFLLAGWGNLFWQPMALQYGKRPVYLLSVLGSLGTVLWSPFARNNAQWIASKILQGFFLAPIETLPEITITDLFFTHERGFYTAVYALCLSGSNLAAPIIAGFIADGQGWHWVLYWCAIFLGVTFVYLFLFMEETNFARHQVQNSADIRPVSQHGRATETKDDPAKESATYATTGADPGLESASNGQSWQKKTFLQKMALWQRSDLEKPNELIGMVKRPFIYFRFPVVVFCGFYYGASLAWFNVLNATAALILQGQYGFSTSMVGVSYVAALIGVLLGCLYTGVWGNGFTLRLAKRNGGVLEAEHRLWLLTPAIILLPASLILWGVGAAYHVHWFGVVVAMLVVSGSSSISVQGMCSYCIESYRALSGEAIVTVILIRNTMSFAVGYGVTPWVENLGLQNAFIVAAAAAFAQCMTVMIMIKWGKQMRMKGFARYNSYVETMSAAGMAH